MRTPPALRIPPDVATDTPQFREALDDRMRLLGLADANLQKQLDAIEPTVQDIHANRAKHAAADYPDGQMLWETDRQVLYTVRTFQGLKQWYYVFGTYRDQRTARPGDLSARDAGYLFYATDWKVTWRWTGAAWEYQNGTYRATLASLPALAAADAGLRFYATDFQHAWVWSGSGWSFADEDDGAGYFREFPLAPSKGLWQLCDGSVVTYAKPDGSTGSFTTPNLTGGVYRKGAAAYTGTINAAGSITLSGNTADTSAGTPAGTVSQPTLTMNAYMPAGTVSQPTFTGSALAAHQHATPFDLSSNQFFFGSTFGLVTRTNMLYPYKVVGTSTGLGSMTDTAVIATESVSAGTPAGTVSQPFFSGTPATLTGTVSQPSFTGSALPGHHHSLTGATASFTADPVENLGVPVYFRR